MPARIASSNGTATGAINTMRAQWPGGNAAVAPMQTLDTSTHIAKRAFE